MKTGNPNHPKYWFDLTKYKPVDTVPQWVKISRHRTKAEHCIDKALFTSKASDAEIKKLLNVLYPPSTALKTEEYIATLSEEIQSDKDEMDNLRKLCKQPTVSEYRLGATEEARHVVEQIKNDPMCTDFFTPSNEEWEASRLTAELGSDEDEYAPAPDDNEDTKDYFELEYYNRYRSPVGSMLRRDAYALHNDLSPKTVSETLDDSESGPEKYGLLRTQLKNYRPTSNLEKIPIWVDLRAPDESILECFADWLAFMREYRKIKPSLNYPDLKKIRQFEDHRALQYKDLQLCKKYYNLRIKQVDMAALLFPENNASGSDPVDRLRKTTKGHSEAFGNFSTASGQLEPLSTQKWKK